MEKSTILVIDDDPASVNALLKYLHESGFETLIAPSGERALRQLEFAQPDIILLDVCMPGIDGFEVCRRLKQRDATQDIPVIFMTALSDTVDKVKGFEVGGVDYLTKPVQHEEVLARVHTHLTIRNLQRQLQKHTERFQKLAEATFEGIIIHDQGRILDVNQAVSQMFGMQAAELIETNLLGLIAPEARQSVTEKIRARDEQPYESAGIKKDGSVFPIEIQMKTMPYQGRDVMVAAVRDITWRKNMEQEQTVLRRENVTLRSTIKDRYKFGEIIGKSPVMQEVYQSIVNAAASDANVLLDGESGTGKELVAHTIHTLSDRNDQEFVAVNCGAVPENLFEREFFGHRKGAFTGATMDRPGYFDRAHKGTLFLDEVGELSLTMQVKLLRVLQDGEYMPLGDTTPKKADVRIIAATNKDLIEQLQKGHIREDFFYRIRVMVIHLPPLRERKEDIPLLIDHFLEQSRDDKVYPSIPAKIVARLCAYSWPGNIRELQNELQRYLTEQRLEFIGDFQGKSDAEDELSELVQLGFQEALTEFEKRYLRRMLDQNQGHREKTAKMLEIPIRTFQRKIKKLGLI